MARRRVYVWLLIYLSIYLSIDLSDKTAPPPAMSSAGVLLAVGWSWNYDHLIWTAWMSYSILYDASEAQFLVLSRRLQASYPRFYWTFDHVAVPAPPHQPAVRHPEPPLEDVQMQ